MDAVSAASPSLPGGSKAEPVRNRIRKVTRGDVPGRRTAGILDGAPSRVERQRNTTHTIVIPLLAEEGWLRRAKRRRRRGGRFGEMSLPNRPLLRLRPIGLALRARCRATPPLRGGECFRIIRNHQFAPLLPASVTIVRLFGVKYCRAIARISSGEMS